MELLDDGNLNKRTSEQFLNTLLPHEDILKEIENVIRDWSFTSDNELSEIRVDLNNIVIEIKKRYFWKKSDFKCDHFIHCLVFCSLSNSLSSIVRDKFKVEDLNFYTKCKWLCDQDMNQNTNEELQCLPFTAAIVELSLLDNHESPLEKLNCFCTTYDLIYAEIKTYLISLISKYSEKDNDIPVINSHNVLPIIEFVIIRSKLLYFYSNIFFVEYFAPYALEENEHKRSILNTYINVYNNILQYHKFSKRTRMYNSCLNISDAMEALMSLQTLENKQSTVTEEYRRQYISQILKSTEIGFIP